MQKRKHSLLEAFLSTLIGLGVSTLLQLIFYPLMGVHIPLAVDLLAIVVFTVASILRGYGVRRLFNYLHTQGIL